MSDLPEILTPAAKHIRDAGLFSLLSYYIEGERPDEVIMDPDLYDLFEKQVRAKHSWLTAHRRADELSGPLTEIQHNGVLITKRKAHV